VQKLAAGLAHQVYYEPWTQPWRVEFEQFGDVIAFGMKRNMLSGIGALEGDRAFWLGAMSEYREQLRSLEVCATLGADHLTAVRSALLVLDSFDETDILSFIDAYIQEVSQRSQDDEIGVFA
jgi:hypothetical protein